ncbi:hypothetical protein O9993_12460 [Vibrio lentus]|nr:hypothetical protein [Vibrio lentus]
MVGLRITLSINAPKNVSMLRMDFTYNNEDEVLAYFWFGVRTFNPTYLASNS